MEVIEKKDLLKLNDDTLVRSILTPKGTINSLTCFRGGLSFLYSS